MTDGINIYDSYISIQSEEILLYWTASGMPVSAFNLQNNHSLIFSVLACRSGFIKRHNRFDCLSVGFVCNCTHNRKSFLGALLWTNTSVEMETKYTSENCVVFGF